jgi:hypothetical protein
VCSILKSVLFGLSIGAVAGAALADEPESKVHGSTPSAFGRTGFYIGANMGGAFSPGKDDWNGYGFTGLANAGNRLAERADKSAFTTGLYVGYRVLIPRYPHLILGPETEINYVGEFRKHDSFTYVHPGGGAAPAGTYTFTSGRNSNFLGLLRGHFGYLFDEINTEVYFSGGFAFGGNSGAGESRVTYTAPDGTTSVFQGRGKDTHTGSAFALGAQYGFDPHIIGKFEILYVKLKSNSHTFTPPGGDTSYYLSDDSKVHFTIARVGVAYQF